MIRDVTVPGFCGTSEYGKVVIFECTAAYGTLSKADLE